MQVTIIQVSSVLKDSTSASKNNTTGKNSSDITEFKTCASSNNRIATGTHQITTMTEILYKTLRGIKPRTPENIHGFIKKLGYPGVHRWFIRRHFSIHPAPF